MNKLIKRARLAGKVLRFAPFLRMAALNGSIVRGEETKQSDIDILIIAKAGRLYTCRAFATALIHLTGWRRHGRKIAGRLCLNCYLNDKNPDIFPHNKKSALKVTKAYKFLIPLVDDGTAKKFFSKNQWFERYNIKGSLHSQLLKENCFNRFAKKPNKMLEKLLTGRFGDVIEQKLMVWQKKRIFSSRQKGDEIFADQNEIRLHPRKIDQ